MMNRYIPFAALAATLGLIFPIIFHLLGLGSAFLPMFLPVVAGSMLLPVQLAVSIALLTPLLSFLLTGMPPLYPPILPLILMELVAMSVIVSVFYYHRRFRLLVVLTAAILADRLLLLAAVYWMAPLLGLPVTFLSTASVIHGIPGMVIMFLVIPPAIRIIQERYPETHTSASKDIRS